MKNLLKIFLFAAVVLFSCSFLPDKTESIKWHTMSEALKLDKKKSKKIFIDFYTDWCGWCKKMDASTFQNPVIAKYMNEKFYAVKFNAESGDTIVLKGKTYASSSPGNPRAAHQLAVELLKGQMMYPTAAYLDEDQNLIQAIPGYQDAASLEKILKYFGENAYKKTPWEEFQKNFVSKIK